MFDGEAFGQQMVEIVRGYVDAEIAPLRAENEALKERLAALEAREPEKGEKGDAGEKGEAGKDGIGIADLLIDRDLDLIATFEDGRTKNLGRVVGRDGVTGAAGADGRDGIDGLGFDDVTVEQTGERSFVVKFIQGERVKEYPFDMPVVLDRGVFKDGQAYKAGDAVTWAGSIWIAQKDTEAKPDSGDGWRLAVKRGRDGKDAR